MNKKLFLAFLSVAFLSSVVMAYEYNKTYNNNETQFSKDYAQSTYGRFLKGQNGQNYQRPPRPDMQNGQNGQGFQGRPPRPDMQNGQNGQGFQGRPPRPDMQNGQNGQGFQGRPPRPDRGQYGQKPQNNTYGYFGNKQKTENAD